MPAFRIAKYKISNGEYLEFVRAGASPPHFWTERDGRWYLRAMFGEIPLPLDWPVYVTHAQASAYARWRGAALPTEEQIHRAAEGASPANVDFENWDPVAVHQAGGESRYGVAQLIGNGWEWTSTVFAPFAGFERFPFYPGYSADFFDGKHFVMKGGSPRTARPAFFARASATGSARIIHTSTRASDWWRIYERVRLRRSLRVDQTAEGTAFQVPLR